MRKTSKYAYTAIAVVLILSVVLWGTGVFSAVAGLLASYGKPAPEGVQAVWQVTITGGTVATAAETAVISSDAHTVDLYMGLGGATGWQAVVDADNIVLTFDLENRNTGSNTQTYRADGKPTSVPQPSGGTGTAYIVARDGNGFWDVAYGGYATGSEVNDKLSVTVVTAASDAGITATFEATTAGFDNFQLSGNYPLVFTIGGVALTMAFHVTGA